MVHQDSETAFFLTPNPDWSKMVQIPGSPRLGYSLPWFTETPISNYKHSQYFDNVLKLIRNTENGFNFEYKYRFADLRNRVWNSRTNSIFSRNSFVWFFLIWMKILHFWAKFWFVIKCFKLCLEKPFRLKPVREQFRKFNRRMKLFLSKI